MSRNFAITGVGGYVAPRHLKAIRDTGNRVSAALDPSDSVGILDQYSQDACFFTEFERFDRHVEKLRRGPAENHIHYLSICAPNHLHDAHARFALRIGADAICEKPLVLNPWNCDALAELEAEYGHRVYSVLQLRLHPSLIALKEGLSARPAGRKHDVCLTYVTSRGPWYLTSWKGNVERSGGLATNIGIHFFDMLLWLFGPVELSEVHEATPLRTGGCLELQNARVRWFLSVDRGDLPDPTRRATSRRFARLSSMAKKSSSPRTSPICTRGFTRKCWPGAASASTSCGPRSSWPTTSGTRRQRAFRATDILSCSPARARSSGRTGYESAAARDWTRPDPAPGKNPAIPWCRVPPRQKACNSQVPRARRFCRNWAYFSYVGKPHGVPGRS